MNKIACYNCSEQIQINVEDEFTLKPCPACQQELKIPKVLGEYIFEEQLSGNCCYDTYKGHRSDSDQTLVVKVFNKSLNFNDQLFSVLENKLSKLPQACRLELHKTEDLYIAFRPYVETSIKDYLDRSRPQSEKAIYILTQIATLLDNCAQEEIFPADIMIGNILMDDNGQIIISDMMFRESVHELFKMETKSSILNPHCTATKYLSEQSKGINGSLFSFGCLSYVLCCGTYPWPKGSYEIIKQARQISPEVILKLRDENPAFIKDLIKTLIDEKPHTIKSFMQVKETLTSKKTPKAKQAPKKASSVGKSKISIAPDKVKVRPRKTKKSSSPLPLIAGLFIALVSVVIIVASSSKEPKKDIAKVEKVNPKAEKIKAVKKPVEKRIITKAIPQPKPEPKKIVEIKLAPVQITPVKDPAAVKAELLPPDLNFDPLIDKLDEYIDATESKNRELEEDKIEFVSTYRDHLLIHFYRKPYVGVFYLHKQAPFRGKVLKADESNIHLQNLKNNKPLVISWKDFEFNQFHEFADYYAASHTADFSLSENNTDIFKKVATEYSKLAVVLDWYGFKEQAIAYKQKSIKFDSSMLQKLDMLIKEEPTN